MTKQWCPLSAYTLWLAVIRKIMTFWGTLEGSLTFHGKLTLSHDRNVSNSCSLSLCAVDVAWTATVAAPVKPFQLLQLILLATYRVLTLHNWSMVLPCHRVGFPAVLLTCGVYSAVPWCIQCRTVVYTVPYRGVYSAVPWCIQCRTVVYTVPYRGVYSAVPWSESVDSLLVSLQEMLNVVRLLLFVGFWWGGGQHKTYKELQEPLFVWLNLRIAVKSTVVSKETHTHRHTHTNVGIHMCL